MMVLKEKSKGYILFGAKQLFDFGMHMGHLFKKSQFYSSWMLYGIGKFFFFFKNYLKKVMNKWLFITKNEKSDQIYLLGKSSVTLKKLFYPIFLMNLNKSLLGVSSLISMAQFIGWTVGSGWFVCHNHMFMPFTMSYALLLGMGYSVYDWIAGCLSNFKKMFNLFFYLYSDYLAGNFLEKKHYMFLYSLFGFNLLGFWLPSFLFLPSVLESSISAWEGGCIFMQSIALIDSNVLSGDTTVPFVSNDDSFLSVNFFFYLFSYHLLKHILYELKKWKQHMRVMKSRKQFWIYNYFTFFYSCNNYKSLRMKFLNYFLLMYKQIYFSYNVNQQNLNLMPYGVFSYNMDFNNLNLNFIDFYFKKLIM